MAKIKNKSAGCFIQSKQVSARFRYCRKPAHNVPQSNYFSKYSNKHFVTPCLSSKFIIVVNTFLNGFFPTVKSHWLLLKIPQTSHDKQLFCLKFRLTRWFCSKCNRTVPFFPVWSGLSVCILVQHLAYVVFSRKKKWNQENKFIISLY